MNSRSDDWKTTYPTVADVQRASLETLLTWDKYLPPPNTDVQRTVHRRLAKRTIELIGVEARNDAPEVVEAWNDLQDKISKLGLDMGRM